MIVRGIALLKRYRTKVCGSTYCMWKFPQGGITGKNRSKRV